VKIKKNFQLFKLNNYTNLQQFSCLISVNSVPLLYKVPNNGNNNPNEDDATSTPQTLPTEIEKNNTVLQEKKSSSGLSGGAIAAIVISCVVAVVIVVVLICLVKSGKLGDQKSKHFSSNKLENSTLNDLSTEPKPNEF